MLSLFNLILVLCYIVGAICIATLLWHKPNRGKFFLIMGISVTVVQCLGYLLVLNAKTLGEAMYGVKIEYLGSVYVVYFALLFMCELLEVKLPLLLKQGLFLLQTFFFVMVFTNEYHNLYYQNIQFVEGAFSYQLSFTKGPIYWLFMANNVIELFAVTYVAVSSYRKMKRIRRMQTRGIIIGLQIPIFSLIIYLLGFTKGYDLMPLADLITFTICVFNVIHYNIFGPQEDAKEVIVDTLADSLVIVDKNHYFITANQSAKDLFPSLGEKSMMEEFNEQEGLLLELFKGEMKEVEIGRSRYQVRVNELKSNQTINGYLLVLQDITESYNYITKLEELRFLAEEASRSKSAFLANMSHEIRTPMNAILGINEIMIHNGLSGKNLRYAKDIEGSGRTLLSIINNILDFAKIESGKMEIVEDEYEMQEILQNIISMFTVRTLDMPIEFHVRVDESIPKKLMGDEVRIRQILNNILGNAVKFTKKGSVTLDVSWERNESRALILMKVSDTGIGIRQEDLEKIFLSFQQVDTRRNHSVEGTGLGLAITRDILKMMGGNITIESTYGKGSTFRMYFEQDILDDTPMGALVYDLENLEEQGTEFQAENARILLVDDNRVNLRVAEGLLEPYGVKIDMVESGMACLEKTKEITYDIIYMDHMMPEMDGVDTLKQLRKQEEENQSVNVPVVALTANAVRGMEEFFLQEGFQGFVSKPVSSRELGESLKEFLPKEKILLKTQIIEQKFESFRKGCRERFEKVVDSLKKHEFTKAKKALEGMSKQAEQMGCKELSEKFMELFGKGYEEALIEEIKTLIENLKSQ